MGGVGESAESAESAETEPSVAGASVEVDIRFIFHHMHTTADLTHSGWDTHPPHSAAVGTSRYV